MLRSHFFCQFSGHYQFLYTKLFLLCSWREMVVYMCLTCHCFELSNPPKWKFYVRPISINDARCWWILPLMHKISYNIYHKGEITFLNRWWLGCVGMDFSATWKAASLSIILPMNFRIVLQIMLIMQVLQIDFWGYLWYKILLCMGNYAASSKTSNNHKEVGFCK